MPTEKKCLFGPTDLNIHEYVHIRQNSVLGDSAFQMNRMCGYASSHKYTHTNKSVNRDMEKINDGTKIIDR